MSFETEKEINAALSVLSKNISKMLLLLRDLEVKINDYSILLNAENYKGYQNLCYICSNEKTIQILKENSDKKFKNLFIL